MSQASGPRGLLDHFSALEDPRQAWRVLYPLPEILLLMLCATLAGMEDFTEITLWGQQRLGFLICLPEKKIRSDCGAEKRNGDDKKIFCAFCSDMCNATIRINFVITMLSISDKSKISN